MERQLSSATSECLGIDGPATPIAQEHFQPHLNHKTWPAVTLYFRAKVSSSTSPKSPLSCPFLNANERSQPSRCPFKMLTSPALQPMTGDVEVPPIPRCAVCGNWGVEGKLSEPLQLNLIELAMRCDSGCVTCALLLAGAMDYFQLHKIPSFKAQGGDFWVTAKGWSQVQFSTHREKKPVTTDSRPHQTFVLEYTHAVGDGELPPAPCLFNRLARCMLRARVDCPRTSSLASIDSSSCQNAVGALYGNRASPRRGLVGNMSC